MKLPYASASSGAAALEEIGNILNYYGCDSFGTMTNNANGELLVQFSHKGRNVTVKDSFRGYATAWLKETPWTPRRTGTKAQYEAKALAQAKISVCSVLRDWVKAQITMVEVGALSFEAAFLGQLLLKNGNTVVEEVSKAGWIQIANDPASPPA